MSLEQLRALIEKYLDSKGYQNKTRLNVRSYLKKLLDFMQEHGYEELNDTVISEYLKGYETTKTIGSRKLRVEEFAEYAKGERQIDMFKENPVLSESEVLQADTDMAATGESETHSQMTEPETPTVEWGHSDTDMAVSNEPKEPNTPNTGSSPKRGNDKGNKREQISLYVDSDTYAKLKDIAKYKKMNVSEIICKAMKSIVDRNYEKLKRIQQYIESENIEI